MNKRAKLRRKKKVKPEIDEGECSMIEKEKESMKKKSQIRL
jgi:hypothetical protein